MEAAHCSTAAITGGPSSASDYGGGVGEGGGGYPLFPHLLLSLTSSGHNRGNESHGWKI